MENRCEKQAVKVRVKTSVETFAKGCHRTVGFILADSSQKVLVDTHKGLFWLDKKDVEVINS